MSETTNIVEQTFSASAEIQEIYNRAQREQEEQGSITPETLAEIERISRERGRITTELAKWFLWVESQLEGLKAQYKPIYEKLEADEAYLTNKLSFIEKCLKELLPPSKESVIANESIYAYYRENERLEIEDEERLPIEYVEMRPVADKKAIKAAIEAGEAVEGCRVVKSYSLQIKHGGEKAIKNAQKLAKSRAAKDE